MEGGKYKALKNEKDKRYKELISMMSMVFYAYYLDEDVKHVDLMYDSFKGGFLKGEMLCSEDMEESLYENEDAYRKFTRYMLERTLKDCRDRGSVVPYKGTGNIFVVK